MNDVRLRPGVTVVQALNALRDLTYEVDNLARGTVGTTAMEQCDAYLNWAEKAEQHLRGLFAAVEPWRELQTEGYWHLQRSTKETPRVMPLVRGEATWQCERLRGLADRLREVQPLFELPAGHLAVVPDTNVFIHYKMFDEIPWPELTKSPAVRLVVPHLVLDELDDLTWKSREAGQRASAKAVLRAFAKLWSDEKPETPLEIQQGVTLQVLSDPQGHVRQPNNDDEILTRAVYLTSVVGNRVNVATGDYGMLVRAGTRGLTCIRLPDRFRLLDS